MLWRKLDSRRNARALFLRHRPQLQDAFFAAAAASGKLRGPSRWKSCEWEPAVEFARERATGSLTALAGVVIEFEADRGRRHGRRGRGRQLAQRLGRLLLSRRPLANHGKTVFNLNPDEALVRFQNQYERLEADSR